MVTKPSSVTATIFVSSVLAKIHMVTKLEHEHLYPVTSSVLAKIHMVTKPQKYGSTFLNVIEY